MRDYKLVSEKPEAELFADLIRGSRGNRPTEGSAGLMRPEDAPQQERSFMDSFFEYMGMNSDEPDLVARTVANRTPSMTNFVEPEGELLNPWYSLVPITDFLFRDKTEEAIPTLPRMGAAPRMPTPAATAPEMPVVDPVSAEGSTQGAGVETVPADGEPVEERTDAISTLLDFISTGEGTYDSYHSGTVNDAIQHWSHNFSRDGVSLSEMTIGQIRERMSIADPTNPERVFAAGRYQVIPETLDGAVDALGLSDDTVFDQETQDKIGLYLISEKRPRVGRYISGDEAVTTDRAMLDLAMEFASFPVPYAISAGTYGSWPKRDIQAGESFYATANSGPGTNRASHTVEETRSLLESIRGN